MPPPETGQRTKPPTAIASRGEVKPPNPAIEESSRERILRTAAMVFTEYGYAATSIDLIAKKLGSTKGRVYHHFDSKPDLFFEIQIVAMKTLIERIQPLAEGPGTAPERLSRMALEHIRTLFADHAMQKVAVLGLERRLLGEEAAKHQKTLKSIVRKRRIYERLFATIIAEGTKAREFDDVSARLAAKAMFGTINWSTIWYSPRRGQSQAELDTIARTLARIAIRGLLPT